MQQKLSKADGSRIWRHFQRFSEYEDLKELYSKCIPELARFEQRIIDFQLELDKNKLIICRFDETLTTKADKISIENLYNHCSERYSSKVEQSEFMEKARKHHEM